MVKTAKSLGMTACGLTDHGTFAGAIEFLRTCRKEGIRPILGCMPSGSLIYTPNGVTPIEQITVGDTVLTHDGNFKKVTKTFSRQHNGFIYNVKVDKCNSVVSLTEEHPIFCKQPFDGSPGFCEVSSITPGYRKKKAGIRRWNAYSSFPVVKNGYGESLNLLDYLSSDKYCDKNGFIKKNKMSRFDREILYDIPSRIDYSYALGVFIGFYLAEGSFLKQKGQPKSIVFSCHDDLDRPRRNIVDKYLRQFGYCVKDNVRLDKGNGVSNEARVDSVVWSEFLSTYCGSYFDRKKLSVDVFAGGDDFIRGILYGVCADASSSERREMLKLGNQHLMYQLKMLLSSVGYLVNVTESWCKESERYNYSFSWNKKAEHRLYFKEGDKYWFPIKEIKQNYFSGKVYNFEVDEDNSYVSHISLHNCEAYLSKCHTAHSKEEQPLGRRGNRHINLIAKNYIGFQNVCTLSQTASLDGFYYDPRLDADLLWKYREGVIATSACLSNTINHFLAENEYDKAKKAVATFKDIYGEDFYLEMMFHGIDREAKILPEIQRLAKDMDVKIIITNDCFIAGTMIMTDKGVVPIEHLQIGDKVVTHKNRLKNIKYINKKAVQKVYTVKTNLGTTALVSTGGHPVFAAQRKTNTTFTNPEWKKVSALSPDDYLILHKTPYDRHRLTRKDCPLYIDIPLVLGEECSENIEDSFYVTKQGYDGLRGKIKIPLQLPLCPDLLFILGRYVAEGWCDKSCHQMGFASNCDEIEIQDRIADYFSQFGVTCYRPRSEKNDCKIVFSSKIFHALFAKLCGVGALSKHLPMINGSYHQFSWGQMLEIIKGYIGGDGHIASKKHRTSVVCATVSRVLAYQMSETLQAMGFISLPTLRSYEKAAHKNPKADPSKWNPLYVLHMSEIDIERLCDLLKIDRTKNGRSGVSRRKFIDIGDYFAVKVRLVTQDVKEEMVYNLQVEDDESYVANSYVVHNCHYIRQADAEFHEVVMCISSGRTLKDPKRLKFPYKEFYFKSKDEMAAIFGDLPRAMNNTLEIADKCDYSDIIFVEEGGTMKLPHFDIPEEFKTPYDYLEKMAKDGIVRLGLGKSKPHVERLKTELSDIKLIWDTKRYDFATYFLVVEDIMRFAKEKDIDAGVRGSGYGSLLLKCVGIVEGAIDPLKFDLLWERFLGFDNSFFLTEEDFGPMATEEQILEASQD